MSKTAEVAVCRMYMFLLPDTLQNIVVVSHH